MDVGLSCGIRLDLSSTDDLAGLVALLNVSDSHDCVIVSGDFDECVTSVEYITFHVNFVVLLDPLGLV